MGLLAFAFIPVILPVLHIIHPVIRPVLGLVEGAKVLETSSPVVNAWVAVLGVLGGGLLTTVVDRFFKVHDRGLRAEEDRRKELSSEEAEFRKDLRQQIIDLRDEIGKLKTQLHDSDLRVDDLQSMVNDWREKYYNTVASGLEFQAKYQKIEKENQELKAQCQELEVKCAHLEELQEKYDNLLARFNELARRVKESGIAGIT